MGSTCQNPGKATRLTGHCWTTTIQGSRHAPFSTVELTRCDPGAATTPIDVKVSTCRRPCLHSMFDMRSSLPSLLTLLRSLHCDSIVGNFMLSRHRLEETLRSCFGYVCPVLEQLCAARLARHVRTVLYRNRKTANLALHRDVLVGSFPIIDCGSCFCMLRMQMRGRRSKFDANRSATMQLLPQPEISWT
jgi:hypothetical protein